MQNAETQVAMFQTTEDCLRSDRVKKLSIVPSLDTAALAMTSQTVSSEDSQDDTQELRCASKSGNSSEEEFKGS